MPPNWYLNWGYLNWVFPIGGINTVSNFYTSIQGILLNI